jgi:eukaryotic-like serine/threonine-protein kinase
MTHMQLPSLQPLKPQTMLGGRYRLEREIGRGGMAIVYLARDLKLDRDVAVKVLLGELAFAMGPERFRREINVVSRLSHPHILPIDDYGELDGHLYYVMPFISGETLHKRLERERQLPLSEAVRIAAEVASALDYAHRQGIVHRDIKPENILLQNGEALVADFGIARAITEGGGAKLTSTGITLGTPAYMSPEQASADPGLDGRSDIYSLGCVLYEMLAGQPPFSGPTAQAIIARHQLDEAPSLSIVRGTIPEEIEDLVMQALAKLPADRFASAGDFATELQKILATGARPVRTSERRRKSTGRARSRQSGNRRFLIAGLAAVPVVAAIAWAGVHFGGRAAQTKSRIGTDSDPNHIAVLYFEDRTRDGQLRFLADGLTEALIDELSAVKQLKVISRNGVAPYKGKSEVPIDSIQRALKVGTVVSGKVEEGNNELQVSVTLEDALTKDVIGKQTVKRARGDVLTVQADLANVVAALLRKTLGSGVEGISSRPQTRNAQAWEAYQRARMTLAGVDTVLAGGDVQAAVRRLAVADSEFARVEEMDKKFTAPIVARGWIPHRKVLLLSFGKGDLSQYEKWLKEAAAHAERALAIDSKDASALELRGTARYFQWMYNFTGDAASPEQLLANAETDLRNSTLSNPLQATAWNALSHLLWNKKQTSEAKLAAKQAYDSDPYLRDIDRTIWRLFLNSLDLEARAEAEKWCAVGRQRMPANFRFTECKLWLYALQGQKPNVDSVWATYQEFLQRTPPNLEQFHRLKGGMIAALGLVRAGLDDSAKSVAVRSRASPQVDPAFELLEIEARVRVLLGDKDEAIRLLNRFFASNPQQRALAKFDESWWWNPIREDPRYKSVVNATR